MNKINFENLPSTTTPINATNLNQLQTNIENTLNTYSTNEIVAGMWTNNKPIYRKVISGQVASADTWTTIGSIANIRTLAGIGIKGIVNGYLPVPIYINSSYYVVVQKNGDNIQVMTAGYTNSPIELIVEYTKTTD